MIRRRLMLVLAVLLHLGIGVFYLAAGLVAPRWAVVLLQAAWLVLLVVLVRVGSRRPPYALLVPVAAAALIFSVVTAGDMLLGWTA